MLVPDPPEAVHAAAAVEWDRKLLLIGGTDTDGRSQVLVYDPTAWLWSQLPSLITARLSCVVTVLPCADVVVMGGINDRGDVLQAVERYDPVLNCWEEMSSLPLGFDRGSSVI